MKSCSVSSGSTSLQRCISSCLSTPLYQARRAYMAPPGSAGSVLSGMRVGDHNKVFADQVGEQKDQYRRQQQQQQGGDTSSTRDGEEGSSTSRRRPSHSAAHRIIIPSLSGRAKGSSSSTVNGNNSNNKRNPFTGKDGKPIVFASTAPKPVSERPYNSENYVQSPQPQQEQHDNNTRRRAADELPKVNYRQELTFDEEEGMPNSTVINSVPGDEAAFLRRQQEAHRTRVSIDAQNEQLYWSNRSHLRKTKNLEGEFGGLEEAVQETLLPSKTSFRSELRKRPLDRGILEEIHRNLHGRRAESRLKKNVHAEHWVMKNDCNLPVLDASKVAQETFGFGGKVEKKGSATSAEEFPVSTLPEVAFVGRTNSGRSSLINAICNSHVARYGVLKGTTTSVDFYEVGGRLLLTDLPGYGFYNPANVDPLKSKHSFGLVDTYLHTLGTSMHDRQAVKDAAKTARGTSNSIRGSSTGEDGDQKQSASRRPYIPKSGKTRNIKRVFICVPAGTGLHRDDVFMCKRLEEMRVPFSVLLVKTDLVNIKMLARLADHTRSQLAAYSCCSELIMVNALRLAGIPKLQNLLGLIARREALPEQLMEMDFESIV